MGKGGREGTFNGLALLGEVAGALAEDLLEELAVAGDVDGGSGHGEGGKYLAK